MTKLEVLHKYFGFNTFRSVQEDAIDRILDKKDLLTILPTGSGKSLIFQLPSLMMPGVTIVISPLIALMQDQVASLQANGISAEMMSSINANEKNDFIYTQLLEGSLKFLYVAPERFTQAYFIDKLSYININFFVIDEAHCVSEWGHEFRDDYRKLQFIRSNFPHTPITAFTATATRNVESDILKTLTIHPTSVVRSKIMRTNLIIRSQKRVGGGKEQAIEFLKTHKDECGIIYCFTRKETEQFSEFLNSKGFDTLAYHAGLPSSSREQIFKKFKEESVKIIVATIAFGMGIDKGNIRFVLHTSMPKTLENYSQEIGRAGRDGLNADVLLLYSKADEIGKKRFIDDLPDSSYKANNYKKLEQMYRFCISQKCRHKAIASYFDDEIDECGEICDNCLTTEREYKDITLEALKFISAILRVDENFGQTYIIDVLRGSKIKRILDFGHDKISVHGIGKDYTKEQWSSIADTLLDIEAIEIVGEFRTLKITEVAKEILQKKRTVMIDASNLVAKKSYANEYKKETLTSESFEVFRELRKELATTEGIPAYMIFSDKTINEISKKLPSNKEEFLAISGVGEMKCEKYSEVFLELCESMRSQESTEVKELSKTYMQTLELINDQKDINEICSDRELKEQTIIGHISALQESGHIEVEEKNKIFKPLIDEFDPELKSWIEDGLKKGDLTTLKSALNKYSYLF
ncbi:MAG: DNA helicase RecQ [Helicobacteraceae bacterium]|nr:DNA helicase RecQ [Helicobacteraceae bacterium]